MDVDQPIQLLSGLSPRQFMNRHWQKEPLVVRAAIADFRPPIGRARLFELAANEGVESRLIERDGRNWELAHGPFHRRELPALKKPGWTLLVQGVDTLDDAAHEVLRRFRFVPDARLDDLMISYASDHGGVGPHFDRYDVFLLQAHGRRRWRIGRQPDLTLQTDRPLKILADFRPEEEFVLEVGDMLYLPPCWAHDGVAIGECMTWSVGFRAPRRGELARELLQRIADVEKGTSDGDTDPLYRDSSQKAIASPAAIPPAMGLFARQAVAAALRDPVVIDRALGELLSEPKPSIWFETTHRDPAGTGAVKLDRRTRMLYDDRHIFINGESLRAGGRDARLMRELADARGLTASQVASCSKAVRACLSDWLSAGWLLLVDQNPEKRGP